MVVPGRVADVGEDLDIALPVKLKRLSQTAEDVLRLVASAHGPNSADLVRNSTDIRCEGEQEKRNEALEFWKKKIVPNIALTQMIC